MSEIRARRVESQIREELSALIVSGKVKDPRVRGVVSITRVETSKDYSQAKVYVSSLSGEACVAVVAGLNAAAGFLQAEVSRKIRLRLTPRFVFIEDRGVEAGFDMDRKLKDLME